MGKPTGFMEINRQAPGYAPVHQRIRHYREFAIQLDDRELGRQGARCMDCGIPFCHGGCPVDNLIPDWNHSVYRGRWEDALRTLHSTNNFPEFTGRVCPAPCEASCTLNLTDEAVTIKNIELNTIEKGWAANLVKPQIASHRTGKRIAVVGAGPAGLAAAQQLARAGHEVVVMEKNARMGGLMRYGIPDFKLEKWTIDRRMAQMQAEGVEFRSGCHVGVNIPTARLMEKYDAVVLACGSEKPRDLPVPGRDLDGVHFAMDFLTQQNKRVADEPFPEEHEIIARDKHVVVIGGGDTGSDCVGTSIRHGARSVTQIEIMPRPPKEEFKPTVWPKWPLKLRTSTSHEEGCERQWSVMTTSFEGVNGKLTKLNCVKVDDKMQPVAGTEFVLKADMALLAMGFVHPVHEGLVSDLELELDPRGNVLADYDNFQSSNSKVFSCGDMRRGQSLIVWAIKEGRRCARAVDGFLMGESRLPG
ncbi:glutamate synthase subunit beta [Magnetospira sp. QH-2]|uniref:glutamate synthase subunit beta n=1 Tax=Magnetospira sp. (strain QH-2) TaxID=1288970 RepID=UPI0003E80D09|nr:glutamate synthase subunit beta [Magnetospira sp. QH-2]CCQ72089.1 Glutamate synthase, small subunit [Magnetospira sp. QH-2]